MIAIRRLEPGDAEAFRALRLQGLQESPAAFASSFEEESVLAAGAFAEWLAPSPDRAVFGAFRGAELVGCVGLGREAKVKHFHKGRLWGMYVAPGHRALGVGRQLVSAALRFAASLEGLRQVSLGVAGDNHPASRLYESFGFVSYGFEPDAIRVDGAFHDEIHMIFRLGEES